MKMFTVNYVLVAISTIALLATTYSRYDEIKGMALNNFIEYGSTVGAVNRSNTKRLSGYRGTSIETYDIEYSYMVDGKVYFSNQIDFLLDHGNYEKYLSKYPVGKAVDVYYDMKNHNFAVLFPDSRGLFVFGLPLFWLVFLIYSILSIYYDRRK